MVPEKVIDGKIRETGYQNQLPRCREHRLRLMNHQAETEIDCPYCGERVQLLIDCSVDVQDYIEDCQVCCRPIYLHVTVDDEGLPQVGVRRDDD